MRRTNRQGWASLVSAVLTAGALLCSSLGGHAAPGSVPLWFSLSVVAFPVAAALAALAAVVALLRRHWPSVAVLIGALLLCAPTLSVVMPLHLTGSAPGDKSIKVLTLNTENFKQAQQWPPNVTLDYILDSEADVVMLQEITHDGWGLPRELSDTTFSPSQLARLDSIYPYRSHDNDDVGIFSRYPYTRVEIARAQVGFDMVDYFGTMEHHFAVAYDVHLPGGQQLRMVNVHLESWHFSRRQRGLLGGQVTDELDALPGSRAYGLSTSELIRRSYVMRAHEAAAVRQAIDDSPENVVVCGDFNDVPGSWTYRTVRGSDLRDAWADAGLGYAHTITTDRFLVRIDHILYRGQLRAAAMRRDQAAASDHYPQIATFEFTTPP